MRAGRLALAAELFAITASSERNARGASGLALAAQPFASTVPSGSIAWYWRCNYMFVVVL